MRTALLLALAGLTQISCSEDSTQPAPSAAAPADPALVAMLKAQYGVEVAAVDDSSYVREVDDDGEAFTAGNLWVEVAGMGSRIIAYEETVHPASRGGAVFLQLEDQATGDLRFFEYSVADNYIDFGKEVGSQATGDSEETVLERGAGVSRREDGKYVVLTFDDAQAVEQEQVVDTGLEALRLVEEFADFDTALPHIKLAAVALGHSPVPEARIPSPPADDSAMRRCEDLYRTLREDRNLWLADPLPEPYRGLKEVCDGLGLNGSMAARPSFCSVFETFCDCAACTANPDAAGCSECAGL